MQPLLLTLPTLGERRLLLEDLDGHAELAVDPGDPGAASRLLSRLVREPTGAPAEIGDLLVAWCDRVLAALFERELGSRVDSQARCTACGEEYAFGFELGSVLESQATDASATGLVLDADGRFQLDDGAWVRPPTVGDVARHADPDELAVALCGSSLPRDRVEAVLDDVAPLLSLDLETPCVHCEHEQVLRFDISGYLLESLAAERPLLIRETHLLASRYGWGHDTIMSLSRQDRRAYASLILGERTVTGLRSVR